MSQDCKKYLGDGVYADWDGYHVVLTTEDGVSIQNTIYLDSELQESVCNYIKRINALINEVRAKQK